MLGKQVPQANPSAIAAVHAGMKCGYLALVPQHSAPDQRCTAKFAGISDQILGIKIIGTVKDYIHRFHQIHNIAVVEPVNERSGGTERRQLLDTSCSALGFGFADIGIRKQHLPLQIGFVNRIAIDNGHPAYPGGGQLLDNRTAQTTGAHHQNMTAKQGLLFGHAKTR